MCRNFIFERFKTRKSQILIILKKAISLGIANTELQIYVD